MMPFAFPLAEASPQALNDWLEVLLYLCGIILAVAGVWKLATKSATKTELANQPIDVRQHAGIATASELKQVHGRIERERKEIDAAIKQIATDAKERADKLDQRLAALDTALSGQTDAINNRIDAIPSRVIALLKDTKQLHQ